MTDNASRSHRGRLFQGGFSLVELMVAVALALLILSTLATVFVQSSQTRAEIERSNRQIESGRYAIELLTKDLRMAGYFDSFDPYRQIILPNNPPLTSMSSMPDPCLFAASDLRNAFFVHVQGVDNPISATIPSCISDLRAGTDVLVIRRASTCVAGPTADADCDAAASGVPYFQASNCYQEGEIYNSAGTSTDYQNHFVLDAGTSGMTKHAIDCTTIANYRTMVVRIYFVANNNVGSDGIPTLKRAELRAGGFTIVPLVDGIENLQIEYGVDANDDGAIDGVTADPGAYNSCSGNACVRNWLRTYSVKVNLLARNIENATGYTDTKSYTLGQKFDGTDNVFGPFNDGIKRHAYNATVRLNNPSSRRVP